MTAAQLGHNFQQLQQETMFHRVSQVAALMKVINERAFVVHRSVFDRCNAAVSAFCSSSSASPHAVAVLPTCCISAIMASKHMCAVTYYRMLCICWECIPGSMKGATHWMLVASEPSSSGLA